MNWLVPIGGLVLSLATALGACFDLPSSLLEAACSVSDTSSLSGAPGDDQPPPPPAGVRLPLPPISNPLGAIRVEKRLFGVLPNYRADQETADYKPLTTSQKFKIAEKDTFDWPNFPLMLGFAMQTEIAQNGWHGKAFGLNFAEYYSRAFGDALIGNFVTEAILPTLLHEDPRFFRSGTGTVWRRAYKAARQVVVTRTENGGRTFNYSEVLGNSIVVAISSTYYPDSRQFWPGAERVGLAIGNDVVANLMTEFWPDVKRRIQLPVQSMLHHLHFGSY